MTNNKKAMDICLLGDVFRHIIVKPSPELDEKDEKSEPYEPYRSFIAYAGVPLLRRMIINAVTRSENVEPCQIPDLEKEGLKEPSNRLVIILGYFPRSSENPDENVLRQKPKEEYLTSSSSENIKKKNDINNIKYQFAQVEKNWSFYDKKPAILVIYDRNLSFRKHLSDEKSTNAQYALSMLIKSATDGVVIGIASKLDTEWLDKLGKIIADASTEAKERCVVVITADALRKSDIDITVNGSLEQAVRQVVGCLHDKTIQSLFEKVCGNLVVVFRETLVVHVTMGKNGEEGKGAVHICPNFKRVMQADESRYGRMPGKLSIMLTAIVKKLYHNGINIKEPSLSHKSLTEALPLGIAACNFFFDKGFCNAETSSNGEAEIIPFDAFTESLGYRRRQDLLDVTSNKKEFRISTLEFSIQKTDQKHLAVNDEYPDKPWSRINYLFKKVKEVKQVNEKDFLLRIVIDGIDKAIDEIQKAINEIDKDKDSFTNDNEAEAFPKSTILCPFAEFGSRKTFDAQEAEDFYALENLLRKYLTTPDWGIPLSIAVFGYPGTGKNSTVREIIKNVNPKKEFKPLEFNLAQFNSFEQLTEAFHKVQDLGLTEECPVVVFDEFDAIYNNEELGWLKFFLAPMQDGEFLGKTGTYHIRRAIFLFTGGTHHTFNSFAGMADTKNDERKDALKKAKHGDFISRLKGYLDVQSINEVDINGEEILFTCWNEDSPEPKHRSLLLRRAILLRSLLEKHAQPILKDTKAKNSSYTWKKAHINEEVIEFFLYAKKYKHGARSMEAIIQISRWINEEFVLASLPPIQQLEAHVDPKSFEKR